MGPGVPPALHRARLAARRQLGAHPALWWAVVAVAATLAGGLVLRAERAAAGARAAWGERVTVLVAERDLFPGDLLDTASVTLRELPRLAVPPGALTALPEGGVAAAATAAGEVVHGGRVLAPGGTPASRVPPGTLGVAVPVGPADAVLGLAPGVRVDVVVADPVSGAAVPGAAGALVVGLTEGAALVAVPAEQAALVARAAADGTAVLVVRPLPP